MTQIEKHINLLGMKVEDKVTRFNGVVASVSFDLYGCIQALVNPGTGVNGALMEQCWIDVHRLVITSKTPVMDPPRYKHGPQAENLHLIKHI